MMKAGGRDEHTAFTFPILLLLGSGLPRMLHKSFSKTKTGHKAEQRNRFSFVPTKKRIIISDLHKKLISALYV